MVKDQSVNSIKLVHPKTSGAIKCASIFSCALQLDYIRRCGTDSTFNSTGRFCHEDPYQL